MVKSTESNWWTCKLQICRFSSSLLLLLCEIKRNQVDLLRLCARSLSLSLAVVWFNSLFTITNFLFSHISFHFLSTNTHTTCAKLILHLIFFPYSSSFSFNGTIFFSITNQNIFLCKQTVSYHCRLCTRASFTFSHIHTNYCFHIYKPETSFLGFSFFILTFICNN